MRAGHWGDVQRVLSAPSAQPLSFTFQLARAMAQRELGRRSTLIAPAVLIFLLGVTAGVLLRHFVDFQF
jgi:hypothetical protein